MVGGGEAVLEFLGKDPVRCAYLVHGSEDVPFEDRVLSERLTVIVPSPRALYNRQLAGVPVAQAPPFTPRDNATEQKLRWTTAWSSTVIQSPLLEL